MHLLIFQHTLMVIFGSCKDLFHPVWYGIVFCGCVCTFTVMVSSFMSWMFGHVWSFTALYVYLWSSQVLYDSILFRFASYASCPIRFCALIQFWMVLYTYVFLGARAPLEIARVKKKKYITKKFQIAITCSLLFLLAP